MNAKDIRAGLAMFTLMLSAIQIGYAIVYQNGPVGAWALIATLWMINSMKLEASK